MYIRSRVAACAMKRILTLKGINISWINNKKHRKKKINIKTINLREKKTTWQVHSFMEWKSEIKVTIFYNETA